MNPTDYQQRSYGSMISCICEVYPLDFTFRDDSFEDVDWGDDWVRIETKSEIVAKIIELKLLIQKVQVYRSRRDVAFPVLYSREKGMYYAYKYAEAWRQTSY